MATTSKKLTGGAAGLLDYFRERQLPGLEAYYGTHHRSPDQDPERTSRDSDVVFPEVWGKYAERLGLREMTREQFTDLVNGEWEGERLVGTGYRKVVDRETGEVRIESGVRTTMIDVVYAAPKSVMTYLVHENDPALTASVIDAWRESVREAFEGMEEHARIARVPVKTPAEAGRRTVRYGARAGEESRMQGSATKRVPAELIALPVLQLSARPTEESLARGYVADPHLHMHVPLIAVCAVPDPDDPTSVRTYTPDEVGIKRQAAGRDAVVMGDFARRLEDLGIALEYHTDQKGRITWEVAGIPRAAALRFSTNHLRAEKLAAEFLDRRGRPPTDPELSELLRMTRLPKDAAAKQVDERGAWQAWHDDLVSTGIEITAGRPRPGRAARAPLAERYAELRDRLISPAGLHREHEAVGRNTVRVTIARAAVGLGLTRDELRTFETRFVEELIPVRTAADPQFDLFALPHLVDAEVLVGGGIEVRAAARVAAPAWGAKHRALSAARVQLSREQRKAVDAMCADTGWANLIGRAGTGKTSVLRTVVEALRDTYRPPEPHTTRDTARRDGHHHHEHYEPAADRIVVVSTSAMVARRSGDAIGADRSYSVEGFADAVRRGVLEPTERTWVIVEEAAMVDTPRMATLLDAAGPAVIRTVGDDRQLSPIGPGGWYPEQLARHPGTELTHVYRQRDPDDVRDFTALGAGKVPEAVRSLYDRGRIIVLEEFGQRAHGIVDLYREERQRGRGAHDVGVVLDGSNKVVDDINRRIQRERLVMEEIGGTPLTVEATDTDRRWLLYRGDHVVFRERVVTRDDEVIRNGERGEITAIDHFLREATVALDGGREVRVELAPEAPTQPVVPAYAHHVAAFQGGELPVAIVSPSRAATRNSGYTAVTRATEDVHIVIDRETYGEEAVDGLIRDWSRGAEKRTAWSQLDEAGIDRWAEWRAGAEPEPAPDHAPYAAAPESDERSAERDPVQGVATENGPEVGREGAAAVSEERPTSSHVAPSMPRHSAVGDDIGERARRGAEECEALFHDVEEIRAAIRDLRGVGADRAAEDEDHEAELAESRGIWERWRQDLLSAGIAIAHAQVDAQGIPWRDATGEAEFDREASSAPGIVETAALDVGETPPKPSRRWGDIEAMLERRAHAKTAPEVETTRHAEAGVQDLIQGARPPERPHDRGRGR